MEPVRSGLGRTAWNMLLVKRIEFKTSFVVVASVRKDQF